MNKGYVLLHRSLLDWEWWDDHNATRLLIYLLCAANWQDKKWKGTVVKAGSLVLSWDTLASGSKLSVMQCRTAMKKLIESGEVVKSVTNKYQVVTLTKWEKLQVDERSLTDKYQTSNRQITTTKEGKEGKEGKEEYSARGNHRFENDPNYDFDTFMHNIGEEYRHYDLKHYHEAIKAWSQSKAIMRKDWVAVIRGSILRDEKEGKAKKAKPKTTQRY